MFRRTLFYLTVAIVVALPTTQLGAASTPHRVLVPIVLTNPVSGAFGSMWVTHTMVLNSSSAPIVVYGLLPPCSFDPCIVPPVPAVSTQEVHPYVGETVPTRFLLIDPADVPSIHVQLRAVDTSRELNTWGTEVPVVDETTVKSTPVQLLAVPADPKFRVLLRIYDFDSDFGHSVIVRLYQPHSGAPDTLLSQTAVAIRPSLVPLEYPGYIQVPFDSLPAVPSVGALRVEIAPTGAGFRIWAFASVTHNATQHITLVTPLE